MSALIRGDHRETRKILETVLAEFIAGRDVRRWVVQIERPKKTARTSQEIMDIAKAAVALSMRRTHV